MVEPPIVLFRAAGVDSAPRLSDSFFSAAKLDKTKEKQAKS